MRGRDYFPLGVAIGSAFCNRESETQLLIENIKSGKHTLLMATRRFGKSSLALHALQSSKIPYVEIDFYMARNEKVVESYILNGVMEIIGKSLGPIDKLITSIKQFVKHLKPKLDISATTLKLELSTEQDIDPATNVKEALMLLESLLAEKEKQVVLLMDEFQNVGVIAKGSGIEGAIRHVAQKTKYLTIIFSGSNRKLLKAMFEDDARPLYKLCWKMELGRISAEHYREHLQKASQAAWGQSLGENELEEILRITERHPFYVNKLCDKLWTYYKNPPTLVEIQETWLEIVEEEKSDAIKEISLLSPGQKGVILQIANGHAEQMTKKENLFELEMSSSSVITALVGLEEKDMIEKEQGVYKIINPVIKYYVLK